MSAVFFVCLFFFPSSYKRLSNLSVFFRSLQLKLGTTRLALIMSALTNELTVNDDHSSSRDDQQSQQHTQIQQQRYPSTNSSSRHSTPNSSGGEKQFHFSNNYNADRYEKNIRIYWKNRNSIFIFSGSGQNSRTSSVAELTTVNNEGFSNYTEIIHHLQLGT